MIYIPTKIEIQKASEFLAELRDQGVTPENLLTEELLAMYAKHIKYR